MKWLRRSLWIVAALVVLALLYVAIRPTPVLVDLAEVVRGRLRVTVDEDGRTRIRETYTVSAPLSGRLERIEWEPGDVVEAGETLLASIEPLDPALLDARSREEAVARVSASEAAVKRAEATLERASVELELVHSEVVRLRELYERAAASRDELDDSALLERVRTQEVRAAEYDLEIARYEQRLAEAALLRSTPGGREAERREALVILSPVSGRVLRVYQESSVVVSPGTALIEVGDPTDLELEVDVLSTDAVKIEEGTGVIVERWGGDRALSGIVRRVEPAAFTKVSACERDYRFAGGSGSAANAWGWISGGGSDCGLGGR